MSEWYETFFDALANDVWRVLIPDDASEAEADFLVRVLDLPDRQHAAVLDLACGEGRLAFKVASRGPRVFGVDMSHDGVERFRRRAALVGGNKPIVRRGDLRDVAALVGEAAPFTGAYIMGNSFGYLDAGGTRQFLAGTAAVLRSGARLVIDHGVAAEAVLPGFGRASRAAADRYEVGDVVLEVDNRYEVATSTLVGEMTLRRGDEVAVREVRHRVSTVRETVDMLAQGGFETLALEDGLNGDPFEVGGGRLMITAVKR